MEHLTFEDYKKIYDLDIKSLIINEWFIDYKCTDKIKNTYSLGYLYMYLAKSNYKKVVKINDEVVGFIFAKVGHVSIFNNLKYKLKLFFSCFILLFSSWGKRGIKINRITNKVNRSLYKDFKQTYKNCIELFIVNKDYRNQGIGSKLITDLEQAIKENNNNNLYLFSDSYSNYEFYLKHNFILLKEEIVDFKVKDEPISKYCIIGKNINGEI